MKINMLVFLINSRFPHLFPHFLRFFPAKTGFIGDFCSLVSLSFALIGQRKNFFLEFISKVLYDSREGQMLDRHFVVDFS